LVAPPPGVRTLKERSEREKHIGFIFFGRWGWKLRKLRGGGEVPMPLAWHRCGDAVCRVRCVDLPA